MNILKTIILLCITTNIFAIIDSPQPRQHPFPEGKIIVSIPLENIHPNEPLKLYFERKMTKSPLKIAGGSFSLLYAVSCILIAANPEITTDKKINNYQRTGCSLLGTALLFLSYYLFTEAPTPPIAKGN
jgi:hypothetical protein